MPGDGRSDGHVQVRRNKAIQVIDALVKWYEPPPERNWLDEMMDRQRANPPQMKLVPRGYMPAAGSRQG